MRKLIIGLAILIAALFIITPSAQAQSISCANVRCAGSCVDTPGGPVCEPQRLTCASTLCAQGNQCIETQSGPQCVPLSGPTYNDYPPRYDYNYNQYYNPRPWRRYWRGPRPSYGGWTPWYDHGQYQRRNYQNPPYYTYPHNNRTNPPNTPAPTYPGTEGMTCTYEYVPVCAKKTVQCFRAPCPPLQKTFGNSCAARLEGYRVISQGTCP